MMYGNWGLSGKQHKEFATFLVRFWILFYIEKKDIVHVYLRCAEEFWASA